MVDEPRQVWYFSYGSNLDPERFRARVGPWTELRRAVLPDHALRFSGEVASEGGGGAVVEPQVGERTYGAVFRIDREQLAALDAVELASDHDVEGKAVRVTVTVDTDDGPLEAELYTLPPGGRRRAPSPRYLAHITDGLRAVGYADEVVARVQASSSRAIT